MTIFEMSVIGLLVIIILLLFSVLKGIAGTMEQRKEIFAKQLEWMSDVYNVMYKLGDEKQAIRIGDETPDVDHQAMFEEGIKKIDELNKEKSKNSIND